MHTVHCVVFNNPYNQHWNWNLFCLFSLVLKKDANRVEFVIRTKAAFIELINGRNKTN